MNRLLQVNNLEKSPLLSSSAVPRDWIRIGFFFALGAALLFVLMLALRHLSEALLAIALPFVLGIALALLLDPLVCRLEKYGIRRVFATALVFAAFLVLLLGFANLVIPVLIAQATNLAHTGPTTVGTLQADISIFIHKHPKIGPFKLPSMNGLTAQVSQKASVLVGQATSYMTSFLVGSVTLLVQIVLALVIAFFLLMDLDRLRARLFYLAPEKARGPMKQYGTDIGGVFSDYLRGVLIVCGLYGVTTIGLLYGLSIEHHALAKYALLVGVSAGILYAIPYLGSTTIALITFLVAFAAGGAGFGGFAVLCTLIVNQIFDNIVTPRVVGGGVGLNPLVAIFALVLGGEMFGLWGMLLSVPIAASVQIVLFRLFPKLTTPTPAVFLRAQGVRSDEAKSLKVAEGDDPSPPKSK